MSIDIIVEPEFTRRIVRSGLRGIAMRVYRAERISRQRGLAIAIVGDKTMRQLNRDFHGVDAPTDVLSFPADDDESLGDIVISYETAKVNARAAHWRTRDELELLVVHGILHLLGYDDIEPEERARMWKRQEKIMGRKINPES
ncbi:MAG: rRNA maturation RNase YbeY [Anaerolineae bacterium]